MSVNNSITSQAQLNNNQPNGQRMVTSAQVMQFLAGTIQKGGNSATLANTVLQFMQQLIPSTAQAVGQQISERIAPQVAQQMSQQITQKLAPLVQEFNPRESKVFRILENVANHFQMKNISQPRILTSDTRNALSDFYRSLPEKQQTRELRQAVQQLLQNKTPSNNSGLQQLMKVISLQQNANNSEIKNLTKQLLNQHPELREALKKASLGENVEKGKTLTTEKDVKHKDQRADTKSESKLESSDKNIEEEAVFSWNKGERQQQQGQNDQQHFHQQEDADDEDTIIIKNRSSLSIVPMKNDYQSLDATTDKVNNNLQIEKENNKTSHHDLGLSYIRPQNTVRVSDNRAEQASRHILQDNKVTMTQIINEPLDSLLLRANILGLKTFSNTADSTITSIKSNAEAQIKINDKKIIDVKEQMEKAAKQEKVAKKMGILSKIFAPIVKLFQFILKPIVELLKAIPAFKGIGEWIEKHTEMIASMFIELLMTALTALFMPAIAPLIAALFIATFVNIILSVTTELLGDKAPAALKYVGMATSVLSGFAMLFAGGAALGAKIPTVMSKLSANVASKTEQLVKVGTRISTNIIAATGVTQSGSQLVLGLEQTKLTKEIADLGISLDYGDMQVDWLKTAQKDMLANLERIISRTGLLTDIFSSMVSESTKLQSQLANSMAQ
ncbi:type III secretion system translocon subunit SctE [Providencia rettgeri]